MLPSFPLEAGCPDCELSALAVLFVPDVNGRRERDGSRCRYSTSGSYEVNVAGIASDRKITCAGIRNDIPVHFQILKRHVLSQLVYIFAVDIVSIGIRSRIGDIFQIDIVNSTPVCKAKTVILIRKDFNESSLIFIFYCDIS